ncbi:hypothetical protein SAMN05421505_1246 [Sinosporangium album]|uniref:Uncharacterized protein n=1 Tax=Sinosporangium album TaxID=504805 RepID=A0A1G8FMA3_9ACTN|nr:hypothetical protein SAMN05421505_1246 [Sinosporangium album]
MPNLNAPPDLDGCAGHPALPMPQGCASCGHPPYAHGCTAMGEHEYVQPSAELATERLERRRESGPYRLPAVDGTPKPALVPAPRRSPEQDNGPAVETPAAAAPELYGDAADSMDAPLTMPTPGRTLYRRPGRYALAVRKPRTGLYGRYTPAHLMGDAPRNASHPAKSVPARRVAAYPHIVDPAPIRTGPACEDTETRHTAAPPVRLSLADKPRTHRDTGKRLLAAASSLSPHAFSLTRPPASARAGQTRPGGGTPTPIPVPPPTRPPDVRAAERLAMPTRGDLRRLGAVA